MILINDKKDPQLVAVSEDRNDFEQIRNQVENMNRALVDSGFDQYQYRAVKRGKKLYIEPTF